MGPSTPQLVTTQQALEERKRKNIEAKRAQRVVLVKRVLVVLAVIVGLLAWMGVGGGNWSFTDGLCKLPFMGPCVRFGEQVESKIVSWGESVKHSAEVPRRVGRKRGVQLSGGEDFGTIAQEIARSLKGVDEVVQGLIERREEMVSNLVQLSGETE